MTEGCKGGWPVFHGFFFENGAMVSEECAPYTGKNGSSCKSFSHCKGIARVSRTYQLKNPTVEDIQKEILFNGAVTIDWS